MVKYFNVWDVVDTTPHFMYMFIGGRGVGKTYSTLRGIIEKGTYFMYIRRTDTELKNSAKLETNPFNRLNFDYGYNIEMKSTEDSYNIIKDGIVIGIAGAVSTFGKFRGRDYSKVKYIIFDEFIPKAGNSKIKDERTLLFDLIETVNRNREIDGEPPVKIIMLSNANTIDCDIIRSLKLGTVIMQMKQQDIEVYQDPERGLYLQLLKPGQIRDLKSKTALYKLTKGTAFYDMAIDNEFTVDNFDDVKKINNNKLVPLVRYDNIYFYTIKDRDKIYISYRKADVQDRYTPETLTAFKRDYGLLLEQYFISGKVLYYNYDIKLDVKNIFR